MCGRDGRGFALAAVLWILVLVSALSVSIHAGMRTDRQAVLNARTEARARWAARSGLIVAVESLEAELRDQAPMGSVGSFGDPLLPPRLDSVNGCEVRTVILDARARLNINRADTGTLERGLAALGYDPGRSAELAREISRWRGSVSLSAADETTSAPFRALSQLRGVPGVDAATYRRIAGSLTVVGDGRVNVNSASVPVLATLPGVDPAAARALVAAREARPFANIYDLLRAAPADSREWMRTELAELTDRIAFAPRDVEVVATGCGADRPGSSIRMHLRLEGGARWEIVRMVERRDG